MVFDRPDYCFDSEHLTGMVEEEAALIETALQNDDVLFGCLKGVATKGISRQRAECWSAVASTLNG